jgi:predicted RNase H-like nuclease (RuvC/YqgF family)
MDDIRVLKARVRELSREEMLNKTSQPQVHGMKDEIQKLQQALYNERLKVTALSEELENPLNVHRWRKLEGSDPAGYELIQKVQTLQKRLISKTEDVVEKSLIIKEKDKQYSDLKAILSRQPGPEVAEQLSVYQTNMKQKTRQMKALASELNMYQAQVHEYKYDIERITRELQDMKKKYYQMKKKDEQRLEMEAKQILDVPVVSRTAPSSLLENQKEAAKLARIKYAGGGYAIT